MQKAQAKGVRLALSNPCVELFGILLHQQQNAWIHRHEAQSLLKRLHPAFDHKGNPYLDLGVVESEWLAARGRAAELRLRATERDDPLGNPTTDLGEAIFALWSAARRP